MVAVRVAVIVAYLVVVSRRPIDVLAADETLLFEMDAEGVLTRVGSLKLTERRRRSILDGYDTPSNISDLIDSVNATNMVEEYQLPSTTETSTQNDSVFYEDTGSFGIDLLFVIDQSISDYFLRISRNDRYVSHYAIQRYFGMVFKEVRRIFSNIKLIPKRLDIFPMGIVSISDGSLKFPSPWSELNDSRGDDASTTGLDADTALKLLKEWTQKHQKTLPEHDHLVAFTRKDLTRSGGRLTQGMAYIGTMCSVGNSISVVEDVGVMTTVTIVAHEIMHSLGSMHDDDSGRRGHRHDTTQRCPRAQNYIMAPSMASDKLTIANTFQMSNCSRQQIDAFIGDNGNGDGRVSCLWRSPSTTLGSFGAAANDDVFPGQLYDENRQCQQTFGLKYRFCTNDDHLVRQVCHRMWCKDSRKRRYEQCETKTYFPALQGTSCGHRMWCINGACVNDAKAPEDRYCKFGDRDSDAVCHSRVRGNRRLCFQKSFYTRCCRTCKNWIHFRAMQ